jgi:hypothetical protein
MFLTELLLCASPRGVGRHLGQVAEGRVMEGECERSASALTRSGCVRACLCVGVDIGPFEH